MSLKKIIRKNIEDDAVTSPKLSSDAVTSAKLSTDFITGQTELAEQAANDDVLLIYDSSAGALKKVSKANTTVLESPTVSSVSPTNVNSDAGSTSFTITGTGFTAGTNARLIGSNGRVRNFATVTRDSTTQLTATINVTTDMIEAETPYSVQVINGTGLNDLLSGQIDINQFPTFVTSAGSLGSSRFNMTGVEVNATDPDSSSAITFELQSGSLPPGISLVNTGANGGTATFTGTITPQSSDTVFNFTLRAVDDQSATSSRAFSFTALGPQIESFTSSGTFSVPVGVTSVDVLVVAGGGNGGPGNPPSGQGGGGGAGGLIYRPAFPVTPGGTISVTVGCGGVPVGGPLNYAGNGQPSTFGTLTAVGGGGGGKFVIANGFSGGSGGGGSGSNGGGFEAGTGTQPTQPGDSGAYGFGNPGGIGNNVGAFYQAAGGGGANEAGIPGASGGRGGNGKAYTIADGTTPVYYAGGGGGGPNNPAGQGGGGAGGPNGQAGTSNRGGGGGGAATPGTGGTGGKGVVIVSY